MSVTPSPFTTICCLLYGDHFRLHERLLRSLRYVQPAVESGDVEIRVWLNDVCDRTKEYLSKNVRGWTIYTSGVNVPKYEAMRKMFCERKPITSRWVTWFDDDSWITKEDWFAKARVVLEREPEIAYMGQKWYVHHLPGQWDFITKSTWFKGVPTEKIKGKPGINFCTGGYVWMRMNVVRKLEIPDERLNHNGGDTLTGEAFRQHGFKPKHFDYGVKVNDAKRRGFHESPAGSTKDTRR